MTDIFKFQRGKKLWQVLKALQEYPYMWGGIDGTHMHLTKKPTEKQVPANYFNCLKFHSILLQGVCDQVINKDF
jgi:hypothetical protein